jgi:hypothetical protein
LKVFATSAEGVNIFFLFNRIKYYLIESSRELEYALRESISRLKNFDI